MPDRIQLEVVTPDRLLFSGEVSEVVVPGVQGYLGILPGHAPLLSELQIGVISYRRGTKKFHLFCGGGFVEVLPDRVSVLAELVESADEIDVEGARADTKQAEEEMMLSAEPGADPVQAMVAFRQASARLDVAERTARGATD